jgi:hypothetical protein
MVSIARKSGSPLAALIHGAQALQAAGLLAPLEDSVAGAFHPGTSP